MQRRKWSLSTVPLFLTVRSHHLKNNVTRFQTSLKVPVQHFFFQSLNICNVFCQAETRAEFAERTVAKLEKSIDDLEGMKITNSHVFTWTQSTHGLFFFSCSCCTSAVGPEDQSSE